MDPRLLWTAVGKSCPARMERRKHRKTTQVKASLTRSRRSNRQPFGDHHPRASAVTGRTESSVDTAIERPRNVFHRSSVKFNRAAAAAGNSIYRGDQRPVACHALREPNLPTDPAASCERFATYRQPHGNREGPTFLSVGIERRESRPPARPRMKKAEERT